MKRSILLATVALIAASPVPLLAQPDQHSTTQSGQPDGMVDTGTGAALVPIDGWAQETHDGIVVFTAPEGDATAAIVGVEGAEGGSDAVTKAWARFDPTFARPIFLAQDPPAREGWDQITVASYETSPAEQLVLQGIALRKGDRYTVVLVRGALATFAKRGTQVNAGLQSLRPNGYSKESFAGLAAHPLTEERIEELKTFVSKAMAEMGIPGVGLALIDGGKIVFEGGLGETVLGSGDKVDANTRFMIASNTKGMATLLLSTLADEGKLDWNEPVTAAYPDFRLGSPETTAQVEIRHLVCACTGLPRKDMELVFATKGDTPASDTFVQLAATEPTSGFGEVFQYNNLMASAAGYIGGHIVHPDMELGAAFDQAMQERIFSPLKMSSTTFDFTRAMQDNWARPYSRGLDDSILPVEMSLNQIIRPYRPAGGAWSTAHDMALYALNELRAGQLADGHRLVSEANLLKRREHNVPIGENAWYGMGLMEDRSMGVPIIFHGGSLLGYKSNFWVLPEAGVGAVLLTNSDEGQELLGPFRRKLLEILYDGKPEADENIAAIVKLGAEGRAKMREGIVEAGDPSVLAELAPRYVNASLGPMAVVREANRVWLSFNTGRSLVGTKVNEDGSHSLIFTSPGMLGFDLLIGTEDGKRTLTLDDSQHKYVFVESSG